MNIKKAKWYFASTFCLPKLTIMKFIKSHLFVLSLIVLMVLDTFMEDVSGGFMISLLFLTISGIIWLSIIAANKRLFWIMIIISISIMGFVYITHFFDDSNMLAAQYLSLAILFSIYTSIMFYLIMSTDVSSYSDISNAISVYLLIGITFGFLYSFIEIIMPGSIVYNINNLEDISGDMIYFSFVTLTTLGFGDILPVHKVAKVVVMFETVLGVLYIAILIGHLVGLKPKINKPIN